MSIFTWKFVDTPSASPNVLLDMNSDTGGLRIDMDEGFELPSPILKRQFVSSGAVNGAELSSASYDNRELSFTLGITGNLSQKTQLLNRLIMELAKPRNLIMYKPDPSSEPIFFQTFRSDQYDASQRGGRREFWRIGCQITAKPFAIGVREDLPTVTVTNDPAAVGAGVNPTHWQVTGVKGDSAAPVFIRMFSSAGSTGTLAWRTKNNPAALQPFAQAESMTLGTDATVVADATASNGNYVNVSFTNNTLGSTIRLTSTLPNASSSEALRGRYRVLMRVRASGTTAAYSLRYKHNPTGGTPTSGPLTTLTATGGTWKVIDIGIIDFPGFPTPDTLGFSNLIPALEPIPLGIQARCDTSPVTALHIDYVYLMPADEGMVSVGQIGTNPILILDGPKKVIYGMSSGTVPFSSTFSQREVDNGGGLTTRFGALPELVPNEVNRFFFVRTDNAGLTTTRDFALSYWPQWREVATP